MKIRVSREGKIWFNDYYEVEKIDEESIADCVNDSINANFIESEPLFETWEPTGAYEVVNCETNEVIDENYGSL